jgi:hypothetical protein
MKRAHIDIRKWKMGLLRLPPELSFLQRWNKLSGSCQLCHTSKIFPVDTLVALNGVGICRVVSEPYLRGHHRYPNIDVEAFGEKMRVNVVEITLISN